MSAPKSLELRPDRNLLNPHFDGYKLNISPLQSERVSLPCAPCRRHPSDEQYSLLHAQLYGSQNHLFGDVYVPGDNYYIDAIGTVRRLRIQSNGSTGQLGLDVREVYRPIGDASVHQSGDYNATLQLVSDNRALLANGSGQLTLLETGDRQTEDPPSWRSVAAFKPLSTTETDDPAGRTETAFASPRFVLLNSGTAFNHPDDRQPIIECILMHIVKADDRFECILSWLQIATDGTSIKVRKRLRSTSIPLFSVIERGGRALLLAADNPFRFIDADRAHDDPMDGLLAKAGYDWSQTDDEIIVRMAVPKTARPADYDVISDRRRISIRTRTAERIAFSGQLHADIEAELTTWSLDNETLTLTLIKRSTTSASGEWTRLLIDDADGPPASYTLDNGRRDAIAMARPVADDDDAEDCDLDGDGIWKSFTIDRLQADTEDCSHTCDLGRTAPIFVLDGGPDRPAAIAIRTHVDITVWRVAEAAGASWVPIHAGTLHAMGYVQASKAQKKFVGCTDDFRHTVIAEAQRHVLIYSTAASDATGGEQRLLTLPDDEQIVGMRVEGNVLLLLTESDAICVRIHTA